MPVDESDYNIDSRFLMGRVVFAIVVSRTGYETVGLLIVLELWGLVPKTICSRTTSGDGGHFAY